MTVVAERNQNSGQLLIPLTTSLTRTIKRLLQPAHLAWSRWCNSLWQIYVNFLIKIPMEEGIVDVQLLKDTMLSGNQSKEKSNSTKLSSRRKGLQEINSLSLSEPLGN